MAEARKIFEESKAAEQKKVVEKKVEDRAAAWEKHIARVAGLDGAPDSEEDEDEDEDEGGAAASPPAKRKKANTEVKKNNVVSQVLERAFGS